MVAEGLCVLLCAASPSYVLKQNLPSAQTVGLLFQWTKAASDLRAAGFRGPADEAIGPRAAKLKDIAERLPRLKAQVNVLALCEKGTLSYTDLQEPHRSNAKRLERSRIAAAISAGHGSSLALVSTWPGHVCVDDLVSNPSYLVAGEKAEVALLEAIVANALQEGIRDVRLKPPYQADGVAFYEQCGFFPADDLDPGWLRYKFG